MKSSRTQWKWAFHIFRDIFFCKPEIIKGREISTSQITLLQIMAEVSNEKFDFTKASL